MLIRERNDNCLLSISRTYKRSFNHRCIGLHLLKALKSSPILLRIAIVENGYDETAEIVGINKEEWFEKEAILLEKSKEIMPKLPIDNIDLLIIEEM